MGNEKSRPSKTHDQKNHSSGSPTDSSRRTDPRAKIAFTALAGASATGVTYSNLQALFFDDLAESLWNHLSDGQPTTATVSEHDFCMRIIPLLGMSTDIYVKICQPIPHFIKVCLEAAGGQAYESDVHFIKALIGKMTAKGDSIDALIEWKNHECPRFCHPVQALVGHKLLGYDMPNIDLASDILTPLQMLFVQSSLPTTYFPKDQKSGELAKWTPLYTSAMQGISVNRFESNVFDYKGHTVTIIKLKDKRVVVVAADTMLRNASTRYGSVDTVYFEVEPSIMRIEATNSIYSNFKIRSAAMGFSFKEILKIDKDLSEINAIEVWGCAGGATLQEQRQLRDWQSRQTEKNKKVPLPGNWDDNPDKTLLEMAGFNFSNERANMEMEARRREEAAEEGK